MRLITEVLAILAGTLVAAVVGFLLYVRFADFNVWMNDLERLEHLEADGRPC